MGNEGERKMDNISYRIYHTKNILHDSRIQYFSCYFLQLDQCRQHTLNNGIFSENK